MLPPQAPATQPETSLLLQPASPTSLLLISCHLRVPTLWIWHQLHPTSHCSASVPTPASMSWRHPSTHRLPPMVCVRLRAGPWEPHDLLNAPDLAGQGPCPWFLCARLRWARTWRKWGVGRETGNTSNSTSQMPRALKSPSQPLGSHLGSWSMAPSPQGNPSPGRAFGTEKPRASPRASAMGQQHTPVGLEKASGGLRLGMGKGKERQEQNANQHFNKLSCHSGKLTVVARGAMDLG